MRKAVKRKLQMQQLAKQAGGNNSTDSTSQFEFSEQADLETALRELLKRLFGNPEAPSCIIKYLESRHREWISGYNMPGWEKFKPEVMLRDKELQLGNHEARAIINVAWKIRDKSNGRKFVQMKKLIEQAEAAMKQLIIVQLAEEEFVMLVEGVGYKGYLLEYQKCNLTWQSRY
ncbi:hypothetical protein M422DRAFT_53543 [Sphaerobolus stellatus SS14]|uniref:Unplaced genomic scaffold SPHSTscaffold_175, whole genome shotgun sequence n=1 Tax=Sphaerobolus stellatus (strain SS14) TaxID=990650 RepID=A0A0C9V0S3_SPHS4|nr:hypothetical protein M422DRAFT_53543 [Sphaerobolus stellatus SS14]